MTNDALTAILNTKNIKGVVLESFGSGNTMSSDWFINSINQAIRRGIIILNVSQCSGGGVIQGKYSTSEKLFQIGVISGKDITTEAALTKMMFLFGNTTSLDEVRAKLIKPLRGEITL